MNKAIQLHFKLDQNRRVYPNESLETALETRNFTYGEAIQLFFNIETQLELLEKDNMGILFLSPNKIFILNNHFIVLDESALFQMENKKLFINRPFEKHTQFMSPEVNAISKIPHRLHPSAVYYSFALMIIKAMGLSEDMIEIKNTKLYFMLKRCLINDPTKRYFIYI